MNRSLRTKNILNNENEWDLRRNLQISFTHNNLRCHNGFSDVLRDRSYCWILWYTHRFDSGTGVHLYEIFDEFSNFPAWKMICRIQQTRERQKKTVSSPATEWYCICTYIKTMLTHSFYVLVISENHRSKQNPRLWFSHDKVLIELHNGCERQHCCRT